MPFKGLIKATDERVDISEMTNAKGQILGEVVCPLCLKPMAIVNSYLRDNDAIVRSHFRHHYACDSPFDSHPESPEHRDGKLAIRNWLRSIYSNNGVQPEIDIEVPITVEGRTRGRVADILVTWGYGYREAHEIQLASITAKEIEERSNDYLSAGIEPHWWLGKQNRSTSILQFLWDAFGENLFLEIARDNSHANGDGRQVNTPISARQSSLAFK